MSAKKRMKQKRSSSMSLRRTLIKGTFLLTAAGMISRLIGFYYRIFLTRTIGAEGIGIYQLIFPVYALCFSLTCAGLQTTVSRLIAANNAPNKKADQIRVYRIGFGLMFFLSIVTALFIYAKSDWIAVHFLRERRCGSLLAILACSIPLGAVHSAVSGYYYGLKRAGVPSFTQLAEQLVRVGAVSLLASICVSRHSPVTINIAVWGLVIGEGASALISLTAVWWEFGKEKGKKAAPKLSRRTTVRTLLQQSTPLTLNRLVINSLQSIEAVLIPSMLRIYGESTSSALSTYGTLTGMALPLVLFPSALTNSVSVLLLPTIAQAQAEKKSESIRYAIELSIKYCLLLGIYCTGIFLYLGNEIGKLLFHSEDAGHFIVTLAWICPFLYITTTLGSIVHGLGKTFLYFVYNSASLLIRIGFVVAVIPNIGILGYLWGVLASQLVLTVLLLFCLSRQCPIRYNPAKDIVMPILFLLTGVGISYFFTPLFHTLSLPRLVLLAAKALVVTCVYGALSLHTIGKGKKIPSMKRHV